MQLRPALLFASLFALACGFEQSNAVDLAPVDGIPVKVVDVRMRETLVAGLGSTPVTLSSDSKPNTRGLVFVAEVTGEAAPYASVSAQMVCRAGEHTIAGMFAVNANRDLEGQHVGTRVEGSAMFEPSSFVDGVPSTCEGRIYYTDATPIAVRPDAAADDDQRRARPIGAVCFVAGELHPRACTDAELPRVASDADIVLSKLHASTTRRDEGVMLGVEVLTTFGAARPRRAALKADAVCKVGTREHALALPVMFAIDEVHPGESTVTRAWSNTRDAMPSDPESCEITVSVDSPDGQWRELGRHCLRGTQVAEGAC
jgi:hypothetical protein